MPKYLVTVTVLWKPPKTGWDPYRGRPQKYPEEVTAPNAEAAKRKGLQIYEMGMGHHKARVKSMKVSVSLIPKGTRKRAYNVTMRVKLWDKKAPTTVTQRHSGTSPKNASEAALENLREEYGPSEIENVRVIKVVPARGGR